MSKADKIHPADMQAINAIASARSFSVSLFKGPTHHDIIEFADAIEAGRLLEEIHRNGRKSIVYAITQEGASIMIPRALYHLTDHALMEKARMTTPQANGASALATTARRSAAMSAIEALKSTTAQATTPAPDAGKAGTSVDLTETKPGLPAFLDATTNADARKAAREASDKAAREKSRTAPTAKAAAQDKSAASSVTSEDVMKTNTARSMSAISPSRAAAAARKAGAARRVRAISPDAVKPIVPLRGPALAEFLAAWAKAEKGHLPSVPDFTADTHKPYRDELKAIVALAKAGDLDKLKADRTQPTWNSRTQIVRYRVLSIRAIEAQKHVKNPTIVPGIDKAMKADAAGDDTAPAKKRSVSEAAKNRKAAIAASKPKGKAKKKK